MTEYIKTLKLADDLFDSVLSGNKKVTIRNGRRNIEEYNNLTLEATNGTYADIEVYITYAAHMRIDKIPNHLYEADGFDSVDHMVDSMKRFYPNITKSSIVTVIGFDLI